MNRRRVSIQVLLYFFMLMLLTITVGCSTYDDAVPATETTYGISGVVSGDIAAGVTINLTGATTVTATTAADGTYSFTGLTNGRAYTLTPILAGYTFNPGSTVVIFNGSDMAADFVATLTASSHTISGKVTYGGGSGVKITFSNASASSTADVLTGADGTYTSPSLPDDTYTVTPYRSGYSFEPANRDVMLSGDNSDENNFEAEYSDFTQADLVGTWVVHTLETGTPKGWSHVNVTIDSTGTLSFTDCLDSTTSTTCPTGTIVWTINALTGVISETVDGVPQYNNHYKLSSNKNFIAGRQDSVVTPNPGLLIAQKKVTGTVYANADVRSKNFVFHQLNVGSSNKWQYGAGRTSSTGAINISSKTDPYGTDTPGDIGTTISVDSSGVVSMSDNMTWKGFLSADKRTIIGTVTEGTDEYHMMIIQLIDGQSSSYIHIVGGYYGYMLATGIAPAPFWAYQLIDLSGGVMSSWIWECSNATVNPPGTKTISVSSSGAVTSTDSDFHGQLSYDEKFMIGTETFDAGVFALDVIIY